MVDLAGDVCILISESSDCGSPDGWHETLRSLFGGTCTAPIHVTLQRIPAQQIRPGLDLLGLIKPALSEVPALWIEGSRVEAVYSAFRSGWIAKLRVTADKDLLAASASLHTSLELGNLNGAFPPVEAGGTVPVTLLENMDPPDARWQMSGSSPFATLAEPARVFLNTITISRIKGPFDYEFLESWQVR